MPKEGIEDIFDIDDILSKELNIKDVEEEEDMDEDVEDIEESNDGEEENIDEVDESNEDGESKEEVTTDKDESDDVDDSAKKVTKEDKKEFAFTQMRKDNSELKTKVDELSKESDFIKEIALSQGYTDVNKFKEDYTKARLIQEAKEKGIDPELYQRNAELEQRIKNLEAQNRESELKIKANNIKEAIDSAVNEYNLGEKGQNLILDRLEKEGYNVETLLNLPNPKTIIKSVLLEEIQEKIKQDQISKSEKIGDLVGVKHNQANSQDKMSLDELLKSDISEYAKNL